MLLLFTGLVFLGKPAACNQLFVHQLNVGGVLYFFPNANSGISFFHRHGHAF